MLPTVAIIGAGYGGAALAKELENDADVTLIDPRDSFVNVAGSLRALARPDWADNLFFPLDQILTRATLIRDKAVSVDPAGLTLSSGDRITADYVVLATGSTYPYPANPTSNATASALEDLRRTHKALDGAQRVLILGAGPVGLELAGETREIWPDKDITIIDPADELLPGFLPDVRRELHRQLDALGIKMMLGARLTAPPRTRPNELAIVTVHTTTSVEITVDIWFQAYGATISSDYLSDEKLTTRTARGEVPVTQRLNILGHDHVYAIGDITNLAEAKMAGYAGQHAAVVAENIKTQIAGGVPRATYEPLGYPMILLPLGTRAGVGQLPSPDGPTLAPTEMVSQYKGADLFTGRFAEQFGIEKHS
ncbi:MAG: FAD-dependent oxidoreductase [Rhodococcus sp. (in: high G+C Gram-positive bacteria)]|uniref:NAD(P)/FAD-dependent oxidoreductase n=2 Tax=unclassified Rhodococcus (in: high G+C Gram-positive bacteria) TaxID=192944 RepID=UPI002AD6EE3E|nr:FAD-dependent oxidoreductase [Rhodococcus sp. (in: high G+C Gram-positive bacteria)]